MILFIAHMGQTKTLENAIDMLLNQSHLNYYSVMPTNMCTGPLLPADKNVLYNYRTKLEQFYFFCDWARRFG